MESVGYLMLGTVIATAAIGIGGYLIVKRIETAINSNKLWCIIDLPGDRLIGAFIATLGLPQINPVNEEIKLRMEVMFGSNNGYDYTYLYPGLQKVVQAAGRVIRTVKDQGVVYLIDDRFNQPAIRKLLPTWW